MSAIFNLSGNAGRVSTVRSLREPLRLAEESDPLLTISPTLRKFNEFWDLMETVTRHGYIRAAMSVVGRSTVSAWWSLRRHDEFGKSAPERHRKRLFSFYTMPVRKWDNIKDFYTLSHKLMIGAMYLKYFGQVAYHIVRDTDGLPIGFDHLPGLVIPNVDSRGYFKSPAAFYQYPENKIKSAVAFEDQNDIIYITNPDWRGSPMGGTDIEALTTYSLPIDMYLQTTAREYLKNRDTPEIVYSLPPETSDDAFDLFVQQVEKWRGPQNIGKSPIAIRGEFEATEISKMPTSLPYQDSRKLARDEELAVTGVSGSKLGLTEAMSSANIREMRREFHEATMLHIFRMLELAFYEQVHVRTFKFTGWEFRFNNPDFLNAVERATVHMRYIQSGVINPNEARHDLGKLPREGGDEYVDTSKPEAIPEPQGSPPEGREQEPDAPAQTGEPTTDDQDPVRGDQHDEEVDNVLGELRQWRIFAIRRFKAKKPLRQFKTQFVDSGLANVIQEQLRQAGSVDDIAKWFDVAIETYEEYSKDAKE